MGWGEGPRGDLKDLERPQRKSVGRSSLTPELLRKRRMNISMKGKIVDKMWRATPTFEDEGEQIPAAFTRDA